MSTTDSPNLNLPYILAAQSQKHVTHNDAVRALDTIVQLSALDRNLAAPPITPADGDRYIVATAPTGAWAGKAGNIAAFQDGAWGFYAPREGWLAWVADEDVLVSYSGTAWVTSSSGSGDPAGTAASLLAAHVAAGDPHPVYLLPSEAAAALAAQNVQNVSQLGVNATADATNKFSVSSSAILFNHAGAGIQEKFNKNSAADTASMLFQTAFSGRAELGTTGDDNLHLKVSPDGTVWKEALVVDRTSGAATFAFGSGQSQVDVFTTGGTWTKPAWARAIEIVAFGGGGAGGGGRRGAAATDRRGGGGGSASGVASDRFTATELGASLTVAIGAGGTAGTAATVNDTAGGNGGGGGNTTVTDTGVAILTALGGTGGTGGGLATGGTAGAGAAIGLGVSNSGGAGGASAAGSAAQTFAATKYSGGGGGGGAVTTANAVTAGGAGGSGYQLAGSSTRRATAGTAGTASGGVGGAGAVKGWQRGAGAGGGGGGSGDAAGTIAGGAGGVGGAPGGGGGGGSTNAANSGAGGVGGAGEVWIISYA